MAGRGRGRGRGRGFTFDVSQLGFGRGEALPAAILQPPPLYPVSEFLFTHLFAEHIYLCLARIAVVYRPRIKLRSTRNFTVFILSCSASVDYLKQKRTTWTVKWGCENIPYCFHSSVWQRRISKIPLTVQLQEGKKNQSLSRLLYLFLYSC